MLMWRGVVVKGRPTPDKSKSSWALMIAWGAIPDKVSKFPIRDMVRVP